jgi:CheY-like chemotaxis protein
MPEKFSNWKSSRAMNTTKLKLTNVMVVDDDDDYNFLTEEIFQDIDIDCSLTFKIWAQDALDFLEKNQAKFPDLIFLDINMPIMNGWEFLEEYESREYHKAFPTIIVMISSSVYREDKEKAKSFAKVADFIEKPISEKQILQIKAHYFS